MVGAARGAGGRCSRHRCPGSQEEDRMWTDTLIIGAGPTGLSAAYHYPGDSILASGDHTRPIGRPGKKASRSRVSQSQQFLTRRGVPDPGRAVIAGGADASPVWRPLGIPNVVAVSG